VELVEMGKRGRSTKSVIAEIKKFIESKYDTSLVFSLNEKSTIDYILGSSGGATADIMINVSGPDLKILEDLTRKVMKVVSTTPGTADTSTSIRTGTPELVLEVDNVRAEKEGISAAELGLVLRDLIQGARISTFSTDTKDYDIYIELDKSLLTTRAGIKNLIVTSRTGRKVPLSAICTFKEASAPPEIRRENKERVARVYSKLKGGYSLADVISSVRKNIDERVVFPPNYSHAFSGQQKYFEDMQKQMIFAILLSVLFMYMILASLYNSFLQPLMIMISLPLAVIGSFLLLTITGVDLDMYGYIGLLMVLGLVAKNAILLLDFANKKREEGMSIRDSLVTAGPIRLRPILMTSFAIVFGMLPLALGLNEGSTGRQALPVTVIGGIITSTFLTLVVVPLIYEWVEGMLERRRKRKAAAK
jgi:HAE1 family hydrophobic/amphiphilic exporter-1